NNELRRQIHIQSEQKRRAQIKCGFEELRNELPTCLNKKMSKVALLHRTVQHIQHLKSTQMTILAELERLAQENEQLRRFQQSVVQKQTMGHMYSL
ncbi:helix-loop-helix DNA-binding protein, partial [Hesseltinella vesiculosa]